MLASSNRPHFIAISETWLDHSIRDMEVSLDSYRLFRRDRSRHGGGVCIYVSVALSVSSFSADPNLELLWVHISMPHGPPVLLGVYYRSPGSDFNQQPLEDSLFAAIRPTDFTVLVGDFNINLHIPSAASADLGNLMSGFGLTQVVIVTKSHSFTVRLTILELLSQSHKQIRFSH